MRISAFLNLFIFTSIAALGCVQDDPVRSSGAIVFTVSGSDASSGFSFERPTQSGLCEQDGDSFSLVYEKPQNTNDTGASRIEISQASATAGLVASVLTEAGTYASTSCDNASAIFSEDSLTLSGTCDLALDNVGAVLSLNLTVTGCR